MSFDLFSVKNVHELIRILSHAIYEGIVAMMMRGVKRGNTLARTIVAAMNLMTESIMLVVLLTCICTEPLTPSICESRS